MGQKMRNIQAKRHQSQWAGQFLTAGEMIRRGNSVAVCLGNTPTIDLLCESPNGKPFRVQVKSTSTQVFWLLGKPRKDVYYIFVDITRDGPARFFIRTGKQTLKEWEDREAYHRKLIETRGPRRNLSGIMKKDLVKGKYEGAWGSLPK